MTRFNSPAVETTNLVDAYRELSKMVASYLRRADSAHTRPCRLEVEMEPTDFLAWLRAHDSENKLYWRSRDNQLEIAGLGIAARAGYADKPMTVLPTPDAPFRSIGGCRFSFVDSMPESEWGVFRGCDFVVPLIELCRVDNRQVLAANITHEVREDVTGTLHAGLGQLEQGHEGVSQQLPSLLHRHHVPNRTTWDSMVSTALAEFDQGRVRKVVLARQSIFEFSSPVDPWLLLARLRRSGDRCFLFGRQVPSNSQALRSPVTFVSASPEQLFRRNGTSIETEAIAGTRPRGLTRKEDDNFGEELLNSAKDSVEHKLVVSALRESLARFATIDSQTEIPRLLKLDSVQHLVTPFAARLTKSVSDSDIINALHPTPAVGGTPTDRALNLIHKLEPFDRGWYAAPIGYVGHDEAEFAVGIRSALVADRTVTVFAGAGLVDGSTAESEWREIEHKIGAFTRAFIS